MESIYGNNGTFPSNDTVKNGGFYVADDTSTLVYQVYSPDALLGTVTVNNGIVTGVTAPLDIDMQFIDNSLQTAQTVTGSVQLTFSNIKTSSAGTLSSSTSNQFNIQDTDTGNICNVFDVLSITDKGKQLMVHWARSTEPQPSGKTQLVSDGAVYLLYQSQLYTATISMTTTANEIDFDTKGGKESPTPPTSTQVSEK